MKRTKLLTGLMSVALLMCGAARLMAEELKPVAVVSIEAYDNLMRDVNLVGQISGMPMISSQMVEMGIAQVTNNQGLKGFDKSKPIGVAVFMNGADQEPKALAFFGATNLKDFLGLFPNVNMQEKDGGFELTGPQGRTVRAVQQGGWALVSNDPDLLKSIPADPTTVLGGLEKNYAVAARVSLQNLPEPIRSTIVTTMKSSFDFALRQRPGEDPQEFETRKKLAQAQFESLETAIQQIKDLTFGLALDSQTHATHLDISVTAIAGSELATKLAAQSGGKTQYAGFLLPDAAVNLNAFSKFAPADITQSLAVFQTYRNKVLAAADKDPNLADDTARKAVKDVVNDFFDVLDNTFKAGKMDCGAVLMLGADSLSAAGGGFVEDGASLEKALKKLVTLGQNDPNFPAIKWDAETYKGVRFHQISIPMKDEKGKQLFGDTLEVYIGIGDKSAYFALGKGSLDLIKSVLDKGGSVDSALPMAQVNVALGPLAKFISATNPNDQGAQMLATLASNMQGKDHVRLIVKTDEASATYRFEIEEGVLKLIGPMMMLGQAHRAAPGVNNAIPNP